MTRKGIKPMPVAVNKAKVDLGEYLNRAVRVDTLTVFNLGRYFNPKSLFLRVVKVDELGEEENNRCSPEHCDGYVIPRNLWGQKEGPTYCKAVEGRDKLEKEIVSYPSTGTRRGRTPRATRLSVGKIQGGESTNGFSQSSILPS